MKQTAVEWLKEQFKVPNSDSYISKTFQQALEMEKQQKEKMYSEEEVLDLLAKFRRENRSPVAELVDAKECLRLVSFILSNYRFESCQDYL